MIGDPNPSDEKTEIRRAIILYVDEVLEIVPPNLPDAFTPPKRNVRLEMTKTQAKQLRDQLTQQLERDLPGGVIAQFKGHLTI